MRTRILAVMVVGGVLPVHAQQATVAPARMTAHVKVLASDEFEGRAPARG